MVDAVTLGMAREVFDLPSAAAALEAQLDLSTCSKEIHERFEEELARMQAGDAIEAAVRSVIASGKTTPDLGGTLSTQEVGEAIRDALDSGASGG